ncbi:hypothetical protein ROJ8625_00698 [Roseivivax jejudonensis]|uniref:Uncharacterized protein n=1 Tax=Roseivivax jejudonensis TaxID=1529041 RepID=A0A1X6YHQ0_9RHOB|nr:hypothetical protein [Roseivivax jejudonensis]SLN19925.1 hypothetical protein ROJ8625_00698 [Roseivivax jejudonensis]
MDEERLIVALEARIRDFERNMQKAERQGTKTYTGLRRNSRGTATAMERDMIRSTTRINQALAATSTRIGAMGRAFAAGAVAAGMAAITTGARTAIRSMADLEAQAQRAGVSVTAFQELKFVAEQNRIDVDSMVDGLKELQLRADEFIQTGKGPAEEAFRRLGYGARDLERQLERPEQLFLDIIDRLEGLDRAAQIRVADEVFGGTGGERFVQLLSQGDEGVRQLMSRAHELGIVMDEETIAKAAELDRKFAEVSARVSTMAKTVVVELADALDDAFTVDGADQVLTQLERLQQLTGETSLAPVGEEQAASLEDLALRYKELTADAYGLSSALFEISAELAAAGYGNAALDLEAMAREIEGTATAFRDGRIDAETFRGEIETTTSAAGDTVEALGEIDGVSFGGVISRIGGLIGALAQAAAQARQTRAEVEAAAGASSGGDSGAKVYSGRGSDPRLYMGGRDGSLAPETSPRPQLPSVNASFGIPDPEPTTGGGGGGSGGGGSARQKLDEYQQEIERTRKNVAELQAEATALVAVAESGREFGDAIEYARKKAELLYAAQEAGKAVTPELKAEIDELALAYSNAGVAAEGAATRLEKMEEHAERGAERMADLFLGILSGSQSAGDALRALLIEIAKVQVRTAFLNAAEAGGGGGIFGFLGKLLSGERAAGGPVRAGGAYLVNERTPRSEVFVPSQNGGVLTVPQAQAALRQSAGGGQQPVSGTSTVEVSLSPDLEARILQRADNHAFSLVQSGMRTMDRRIPARMAQYRETNT